MLKYTNIEKVLGLQENQQLAVDVCSGFYCDKISAEKIEAYLAEAEKTTITADANVQALSRANETIGSLNAKVTDLNMEIANLKKSLAEREQKLTEAEGSILDFKEKMEKADKITKQAQNEIDFLKQSLSEKEAEISELSKNAPSAPIPTPSNQNEEEMQEEKNPAHFYEPGMSPAEARKALQNRKKQLQAKF